METPEAIHLARIPWQFFITLTFKQERLPEKVRLSMWIATIRVIEKMASVRPKALDWVLRAECGEALGRFHYHVILAGLPAGTLNSTSCFFIEDAWRRIGGGHPSVRLFDHTQDGVGYVLKRLNHSAFSGRDVYETGKFDSRTATLTLSEAVAKKLRSPRGMTDRVVLEH